MMRVKCMILWRLKQDCCNGVSTPILPLFDLTARALRIRSPAQRSVASLSFLTFHSLLLTASLFRVARQLLTAFQICWAHQRSHRTSHLPFRKHISMPSSTSESCHPYLGRSHMLTWAVLWAGCLFPQAAGTYVPFLPQGFFFDWTPAGQTPPIPTTAQCDTIHISWERGTAVGPNPTAPYYLQVYTSTFVVPFIIPAGSDLEFDWVVPFIPGTQYQICMFDSNGVSGGCQGMYTVYQAPNFTTDNPPTCRNLTYPQPNQVLGIDAQVDNGPLSQFGWVDQCTDISLTPKNGTPPFTMTVAPALHPPWNITSNTMDAINWTVALSWGMPFFISLIDSSGLTWANGPLHSGGGGPTNCLLQTATSGATTTPTTIRPWVAAVSGIGGLLLGLLIGLLGAILFYRHLRRHSRHRPDGLHRKSSSMSITTPVMSSPPHEHYRDLPTTPFSPDSRLSRDPSYQIEPFVLPADHEFGARPSSSSTPSNTAYNSTGSSQPHSHVGDRSRSPDATSPSLSTIPTIPPPLVAPSRPLAAEARTNSQVYVVHHDAGRPPVTVYTADGTEVVELPPRYNESNPGTSATSTALRSGIVPPLQVQERRQAALVPPKSVRRVAN